MNVTERNPRGFSLIELLVVISIIIILAALLVPLLQWAQAQALTQTCASKARAIATAVQAYSASWKGFTNPDASAYVKDFGFRLSTETGYKGETAGWYDPNADKPGPTQAYARSVTDFTCPMAKKTKYNSHGYPSSYIVNAAYSGGNIAAIDTDPADTLVVSEDQKRHPGDGLEKELQKHYVFGDLHISLGWKKGYISGLTSRWWNSNSSMWNQVQQEHPGLREPDYESIWGKTMTENVFGFLPNMGRDGWGTQTYNGVNNILVRMDGYLTFPDQGTWLITSRCDDWSMVWVDMNENGKTDGGEIGEYRGCCRDTHLKTYKGITQGKRYKCMFMYMEGGGGNYFNFFFSPDIALEDDPSLANKFLIPSSSLWHLP